MTLGIFPKGNGGQGEIAKKCCDTVLTSVLKSPRWPRGLLLDLESDLVVVRRITRFLAGSGAVKGDVGGASRRNHLLVLYGDYKPGRSIHTFVNVHTSAIHRI